MYNSISKIEIDCINFFKDKKQNFIHKSMVKQAEILFKNFDLEKSENILRRCIMLDSKVNYYTLYKLALVIIAQMKNESFHLRKEILKKKKLGAKKKINDVLFCLNLQYNIKLLLSEVFDIFEKIKSDSNNIQLINLVNKKKLVLTKNSYLYLWPSPFYHGYEI